MRGRGRQQFRRKAETAAVESAAYGGIRREGTAANGGPGCSG